MVMNNKVDVANANDGIITDSKAQKLRKFLLKSKIKFLAAVVAVAIISTGIILILTVKTGSKIAQEDKCLKFDSYEIVNNSRLGKYSKAAVAAENEVCSTIGKQILLKNGSAVDAAIATVICGGVMNPHSSGIGGGFFMLVYIKNQTKAFGLDARETAPLLANSTMFVNKTKLSSEGGLAVAIPGEIAGYWEAWKMFGRLKWAELFEPAIQLCRNGIRVSTAVARQLGSAAGQRKVRKDAYLRNIFINATTNATLKKDDLYTRPEFANTLETISKQGVFSFYNGSLTNTILKEINEQGGIFVEEDLNKYKVQNRQPIEVKLTEKYRAHVLPPPSSGVLVTFILKVMEKFNFTENYDENTDSEVLFYHRLIETFKHAFAHRFQLGDSSFVNTTNIVKNLTDDDYIDSIFKRINDKKTFDYSYYGLEGEQTSDHGTSHISVLAENGDAVSLTSTINVAFGAGFGGPTTGIIYNNEMDDFSSPGTSNIYNLPPGEANYIKPNKRPMSSMSPIIILNENNEVRLILGGSGGSRIITGVASSAINNLLLNKNIYESIEAKRLHSQWLPIESRIEKRFSEDLRTGLKRNGHKLCALNVGESVCQGIEKRQSGEIWAYSDFRKDGQADGY